MIHAAVTQATETLYSKSVIMQQVIFIHVILWFLVHELVCVVYIPGGQDNLKKDLRSVLLQDLNISLKILLFNLLDHFIFLQHKAGPKKTQSVVVWSKMAAFH